MSDFHNYSPDRVSFTFMGLTINTGYQDNTFIDVERTADGFTDHVGSLGDVVRTANLDRTGKVTLTLQSQSPANDLLQAIADQDEQFRTGYGPLQIMDHNGNMECHATIAWIQKRPKIDRAKTSGSTVWVFRCADIEIDAGGNVTPF